MRYNAGLITKYERCEIERHLRSGRQRSTLDEFRMTSCSRFGTKRPHQANCALAVGNKSESTAFFQPNNIHLKICDKAGAQTLLPLKPSATIKQASSFLPPTVTDLEAEDITTGRHHRLRFY